VDVLIVAYSAIKLQIAPKQEFQHATTAVSRAMFQRNAPASRNPRRVTSAVWKAISQKTVPMLAVQHPHLAGMSVIVAEKQAISLARALIRPVPAGGAEAEVVAMEAALEEEGALEVLRKLAILVVA